jgi:hypothetical protein
LLPQTATARAPNPAKKRPIAGFLKSTGEGIFSRSPRATSAEEEVNDNADQRGAGAPSWIEEKEFGAGRTRCQSLLTPF